MTDTVQSTHSMPVTDWDSDCPRADLHEPWPKRFFDSAEYILHMRRTHRQMPCPGCGLWKVWVLRNNRRLTAQDRNKLFWLLVNKTETCWLWVGHPNSAGYGKWNRPRLYPGQPKSWRAHIYSYLTLVGPIPQGKVLDHLCRVPLCVNPAHLEPVTRKENTLRGNNPPAEHARQTHCINNHEFTPENIYWWRGNRYCRTCRRNRNREWQRNLREKKNK